MESKWLVIGVSGATCGGKTTLATAINHCIPNSKIISQDDYFLDVQDHRHVWVPDLNHINFDIITSLDMQKMTSDILDVLRNVRNSQVNGSQCISEDVKEQDSITFSKSLLNEVQTSLTRQHLNVLVIEGFCVLNYKPIEQLCDLKYFITLEHDECLSRRINRVYEPPDCPGYFEKCVWPAYLEQVHQVRSEVKNVTYLNGAADVPLQIVLEDINKYCHSVTN